ncbi:hypothetical protein [Streptomyces sp. NPDC056244]|uniref:hypothetical protein n=1 Tax=Streptomyces sp. NPDC056244 TaxID=3345762 RepID=UPI0035DE7752
MSVEHDDQSGAAVRARRPRWWWVALVAGMVGVAGVAFVAGVAVSLPRSDTATPRPAPGPASRAEMGSDPTSQAELVSTLRSLLPEGTVTEANEHEIAPDARSNGARIIYDDGNGPAGIRISFSWLESGAQTELTIECQPVLPTEYGDCIGPVKLPDGSRVSLTQGYADINRRVDTKQWLAQLSTKSGYYISITEWNAVDSAGAPVTRDEPPLSQEQLKKLITADVWRRVAPHFSEISMPPDPSVKDVLDIAVQLLPEGLDVIGKGTEYPYLTVDDGKGITTVQINVHFDAFKTGPEAYPKDDETRVPPEGPGDKGVEGSVMWTAETKLDNDLHIVISAFNPGSHGVPTRPAPALTKEQLWEMTLSTEWKKLVA